MATSLWFLSLLALSAFGQVLCKPLVTRQDSPSIGTNTSRNATRLPQETSMDKYLTFLRHELSTCDEDATCSRPQSLGSCSTSRHTREEVALMPLLPQLDNQVEITGSQCEMQVKYGLQYQSWQASGSVCNVNLLLCGLLEASRQEMRLLHHEGTPCAFWIEGDVTFNNQTLASFDSSSCNEVDIGKSWGDLVNQSSDGISLNVTLNAHRDAPIDKTPYGSHKKTEGEKFLAKTRQQVDMLHMGIMEVAYRPSDESALSNVYLDAIKRLTVAKVVPQSSADKPSAEDDHSIHKRQAIGHDQGRCQLRTLTVTNSDLLEATEKRYHKLRNSTDRLPPLYLLNDTMMNYCEGSGQPPASDVHLSPFHLLSLQASKIRYRFRCLPASFRPYRAIVIPHDSRHPTTVLKDLVVSSCSWQ